MHDCAEPHTCGFQHPERISPDLRLSAVRAMKEWFHHGLDGKEIELRTEVEAGFFAHALDRLRRCTDWTRPPTEDIITDTYNEGVRTRRYHGTGSIETVRKSTLGRVDLIVDCGDAEQTGFPTRARMSFAGETPVTVHGATTTTWDRVRRQRRYTFVAEGMAIELSVVWTGGTLGELEGSEPSYVIEIELLEPGRSCCGLAATRVLMGLLQFSRDPRTALRIHIDP